MKKLILTIVCVSCFSALTAHAQIFYDLTQPLNSYWNNALSGNHGILNDPSTSTPDWNQQSSPVGGNESYPYNGQFIYGTALPFHNTTDNPAYDATITVLGSGGGFYQGGTGFDGIFSAGFFTTAAEIDLSNLQNGTYSLVVYCNAGGAGRNMSLSVNGGSAVTNAFTNPGSWVSGNSYLKVDGISVTNGTMTIAWSSPDGPGQEVDFNGLQLEKLPPPPSLNIAPAAGNQSALFWASSSGNYILQSTTNLASPNWVTVTNGTPIIGVTLTNTSPAAFFRLQP